MKRAQYQKMGNFLALTIDPNVPLEIHEARNAVEVARSHAADKYAPEVFSKAEASLKIEENDLASKASKNKIIADARLQNAASRSAPAPRRLAKRCCRDQREHLRWPACSDAPAS
jgi:hypothetical protein